MSFECGLMSFSCDSSSKRFRDDWNDVHARTVVSVFVYSLRDAINHSRDLKTWKFISDRIPVNGHMDVNMKDAPKCSATAPIGPNTNEHILMRWVNECCLFMLSFFVCVCENHLWTVNRDVASGFLFEIDLIGMVVVCFGFHFYFNIRNHMVVNYPAAQSDTLTLRVCESTWKIIRPKINQI